MRFVQFWVTLCLFSMEVLHMSVSITVRFLEKEALYVAPGRTLVLEAQFQLQQNEKILFRTWERKNSDGEVRVAEGDKANNNRTFVEKNGALLRINRVENSDFGIYKVTVTAATGDQASDSRQVIKITNPPNASLSMHCSVPAQGAQWDSPSFSWQVDGISITDKDAEISENGSTLRLTNLGRTYACITDSSQGTSKVEVRMKEPDPEPKPDPSPTSCSCTGLIASLIIVIVILCVVIGVCCYKMYTSRGCLRKSGERGARSPNEPY